MLNDFSMKVLFAPALALALLAASPTSAEELVRLETRPGVTQAFWVMVPEGSPKAAAILFAGSEGVLNSATNPNLHNNNFLIRSRARFAA